MNIFKDLKIWREERGVDKIPYNHLSLVGYLTEEISEGIKDLSSHESIDWRVDAIVFLINSIEQDGYNAEMCLNEGIKEISSRTGAYNPTSDKWEKFKTDEATALWYKADYSFCVR